jgi:hypothetical protein
MRPTWIVLGLVVGLGAVAYMKVKSKADGAALVRPTDGQSRGDATDAAPAGEPGKAPAGTPALAGATTPAAAGPEAQAADLRARIAAYEAKKDAAGVAAVEAELDGTLRDTDEARRHAVQRGLGLAKEAEGKPLEAAVPLLDRARRDLSRGVDLPEMYDPTTGKPTEERRRLVERITAANVRVMTAPGGVPKVTAPYVVRAGDSPVGIVTRERLPYGHNAILHWNHGGDLDPRKLRAGETLLLPQETLSVRVLIPRRRLELWIGDWLAKDFEIGVGTTATPTPPGDFTVGDKQLNPEWHQPGRVVPYGHPDNELGDAWVAIASPEKPTGYGIHGTNRPDTVGTMCSHGCVRLRNEEAKEVFWWVRTGRSGGTATRVAMR